MRGPGDKWRICGNRRNGAKLIQNRLLVFFAGLAITFPNGFKVFPPGTLYHIKVSFSVTFNMAQRYFLEYLSVTYNAAQIAGSRPFEKLLNVSYTEMYSNH
jgi:hypothetical protein